MQLIWRCRDRKFDLEARPLVMGILNVTPDSFSDGGRHLDPHEAIAHAKRMTAAGADLIDVGAESTRPGARPVPAEVQWRRLGPLIAPLAAEGITLSIDTASAEVAAPALAAGAHVINDVTALSDPGMSSCVARAGAGVVLMHMRGTPATMQHDPRYEDVVGEVRGWLAERFDRARDSGVDAERIALDPGIGFGKTVAHNLELLARLEAIVSLGRPVLVGVSRKGFIGAITGRPVDQRLNGGIATASVAVFLGARIVRTHDVRATREAVDLAEAIRRAGAREATLGPA